MPLPRAARGPLSLFAVVPLLACSFLAGSLLPAPRGHAQVRTVEPYVVVVTRPDVALRAGPGAFYPVATLKPGIMMKADAEDGGFLRVAYPPGLRAFIPADAVEPDAAGASARLVRPSRLKAANMTAGERASWQSLLEKELDPGATLTLIEPIKDDLGKVTAYAVAAPPGAKGWVNREFVRRATPDEAALFDRGTSTLDAPAPQPAPASTPSAAPAPAAAPVTPAPAAPSGEPGQIPGTVPVETITTPATPGAPAPSGEPAPSTAPGTTVIVEPEPATPVAPVAPAAAGPAAIQQLVATYETVRRQPLMEAELDQTILEFEKAIDAAGDDRTRRYLQRFVEVLSIRRELRETLRASEQRRANVEAAQTVFREELRRYEASAVYQMIGRLTVSTVYDGERAPRLYRVVSPEPAGVRTLAYLIPSPELRLEDKVGRVVGIIGSMRIDESLRANVVTPSRVDVLNINPASTTSIAPPDPDPATAPAPTPETTPAPAGTP